MILVVSDLHLGRVPSSDEQSLSELKNCVGFLGAKISQIVFLGDTFDAFIEYPGRIHRPVRLWTALAQDWQKTGINISYFSGNHDRWHLNYIYKTLNIPVFCSPQQVKWGRQRVWMEHGDCVVTQPPVVRFLRNVSDRTWAYQLYRTFLPFGAGQWLATQVSRKLSNFSPEPRTVAALEAHAESLIKEDKSDLVIMGHCHTSSLRRFARSAPHQGTPDSSDRYDNRESCNNRENDTHSGIYINTGDWYQARTFVTISDRVQLLRWTDRRTELIAEEILS